jgi:glycosyltransferase involved in cell wall biosynthesis
MISLIVSSVTPDLRKRLSDSVAVTIGVDYELKVFDNSKDSFGLCKVYNMLAEQAKGDYLCFIHEDLLIKTIGWGEELENFVDSNQDCGVIGLCGCTKITKMFTGWWAQAAGDLRQGYFSSNQYPQGFPDCYNVCNKNPDNELFSKVLIVDGMFLFVKKKVWEEHKFDEQTFNRFHFYDADFSFSVAQNHQNYVYHGMLSYHYKPHQAINGPKLSICKDFYEDARQFAAKWRLTC